MRTPRDNQEETTKRISILGSTGSIGTQTLDIVRRYPERFSVSALTAYRNWEILASQAKEFLPKIVVIADSDFYPNLRDALKGTEVIVLSGKEGLKAAASMSETDIVVGALVGFSGFSSAIEALNSGKTLALANKETLVVAGEIIEKIVERQGRRILPVDSEHSAIFQCISGEDEKEISKIILTASGGPFRTLSEEEFNFITPEKALCHPNWNMGNKVTIDSATMMNKGFEVIEAKWLFNKSPHDIDVVVHPESVVHSMVKFIDGSVKAQMGIPDMRVPIEVALSYPGRLDLMHKDSSLEFNIVDYGRLSFFKPDFVKFPLLKLAYDVIEAGGLYPTVMNAANEVAVEAFLKKQIGFTDISLLVKRTVDEFDSGDKPNSVTIDTIYSVHELGTKIACQILNRLK